MLSRDMDNKRIKEKERQRKNKHVRAREKGIKMKLLERKAVLCDTKNTMDGINDWLDIVEEKISELEDLAIETI